MTKTLPWADKNLGQHFLRSQNVIDSITNDFKEEAQAIIEVGPGPGILTEFLAKHELPFFVIEKDKRFPEYLEQFIPSEAITLSDALEIHLEDFFEQKEISNKDIWLVSNLPYNVSVPLLISFIKAPQIKYMTLMFQREVADKVISFMNPKKNKSMGSLLVLSQTYFDVSVLCQAPPGAFQPPPKVDSTVVSFKRRENPVIALSEFKQFESFLRKLFQFKRKQLGSVLKSHYSPEKLADAFEKSGVLRTDRAESFSLEIIQNLYKELR
ncbi:ribosomal RNA small subunit methyltransferase A [Halobacteriovorax marinus]|uniref:16S rRNA (adenine(1518)-N(6)/adenine(1519)-N(6))- dimethyltransferase RsmA n=1 Tax=Halobacteriovorax marinus TaxID=97084 RepID=UPI000BC2F7E2|nr:16S rRNA (adenine(1518)-N(6)/adenine(1519)-N(6))-dimethyltransferase RsmA [Halobacteriovorax marinus]ATH07049.1 ribosomal RNA small subunit methyltransferase A [Halobacteriovorax marinus]